MCTNLSAKLIGFCLRIPRFGPRVQEVTIQQAGDHFMGLIKIWTNYLKEETNQQSLQ